MSKPKLVEEKAETRGTIAKFGIFWGLLVLPFVVIKRFRNRRQTPQSRAQRYLKQIKARLPGRR